MRRLIRGKNKREIKAQITVFAAMILVLVISLICTTLKSASVTAEKTGADMALYIGAESLFSEYSKRILDEYDVFYLNKSEEIELRLKKYIENNSMNGIGFAGNNLESVELKKLVMATDNGGESLKKQIMAYMKYGSIAGMAELFSENEKSVKRSEILKKTIDEIIKCGEKSAEADAISLKLAEIIDGLKADSKGFVSDNKLPVTSSGSFVKMIVADSVIPGDITPREAGIEDARVFQVVKSRYVSLKTLTDAIAESAEYIKDDYQNIGIYGDVYTHNTEELNLKITENENLILSALDLIAKNKSVNQEIEGKAKEISSYVSESKSVLGEEIASEFQTELLGFSESKGEDKMQICDIQELETELHIRLEKIRRIQALTAEMRKNPEPEDIDGILQKTNECISIIYGIDNSKLKIDYSKIQFGAKGEGLGSIEEILKFMEDGVLSLVIKEKNRISEKKIDFTDLASAEGVRGADMFEEDYLEKALYNEYVFTKLDSFLGSDTDNSTDKNVDDAGEENNLLDYSIEYILAGNSSDRKNLSEVVTRLSLMREGADLFCIFTDSEKKTECYTLAVSLLGFTGNPVIIKAGQYFIMSVWAYGEALMDVRRLCSKESVPFIKASSDWKLSLKNLLAMNFYTEDKNEKNKISGPDYEQYLGMLLISMKPSEKYLRTMDIMELRMIGKGQKDFRMKNCIYSICCKASFTIGWLDTNYEKEMRYSY